MSSIQFDAGSSNVSSLRPQPEDDMETSIIQLQVGQSALRAVRDLTVGEAASIGAATLNELKREDLGCLLSVIHEHLDKHLTCVERQYELMHRAGRQRMQ